jgi:AcrR family transcriptional regulator
MNADGAEEGDQVYSESALRILEAAAKLFSEHGYEGATTRAIAAEAGVNEVTLFRNFGSKENLLLAVVERFSALPRLGEAFAEQISGDYRQDLLLIGRHYLEMLQRNLRPILMTIFEAQRLPEVRRIIARPPARQRRMLGRYLRRQMAQGVVRELPDPELTAQAFFGMFFEYSLGRNLIDEEGTELSMEAVVEHLVDLFVRGTLRREGDPCC